MTLFLWKWCSGSRLLSSGADGSWVTPLQQIMRLWGCKSTKYLGSGVVGHSSSANYEALGMQIYQIPRFRGSGSLLFSKLWQTTLPNKQRTLYLASRKISLIYILFARPNSSKYAVLYNTRYDADSRKKT